MLIEIHAFDQMDKVCCLGEIRKYVVNFIDLSVWLLKMNDFIQTMTV